MAVSELCKRLCRYLLHRYLGPFLEEKVAVDQLHLSLDKGTGTVTQLSLDAAHLNEILSKYQVPFKVVDGYIGSVTIYLPLAISTASFSSVLSVTAESFSNFGGLRLELADVQFTVRGLDVNDTVVMGHSLDLLATSLCTSDFTSASQSLAIDYSQSVFNTGIALPLEGLDQLASVIDSIVSQVEIIVKELVVRLEPYDTSWATTEDYTDTSALAAIELHLMKACASLSSKESSREVSLSLSNIEVRAETLANNDSRTATNSNYIILLRIPDANVSLSSVNSTSPTFFTKVIASSMILFFPGPDILCSVISMMDLIFGKERNTLFNTNADTFPNSKLFESMAKDTQNAPSMFESCAGSGSVFDQNNSSGDENQLSQSSTSPSVHLVIHVVRAACIITYATPKGSLTPESMSVAFFASLPSSDCGLCCTTSRNAFISCCPADFLIVQLLSGKIDIIFNAHQQHSVNEFESIGRNTDWFENCNNNPVRVAFRLSVDCFDISDCVHHQNLSLSPPSQCQSTQLLICDDAEDVRSAFSIEMSARFSGFWEGRLSFSKPCHSNFDVFTIYGRILPLYSRLSYHFSAPNNQPQSSLISRRLSKSSGIINVHFDKLKFACYFPSTLSGHNLDRHLEVLFFDAEKLDFHITRATPSSPFAEAARNFSIDCFMFNCFLQSENTNTPLTALFRANTIKIQLSKQRISTSSENHFGVSNANDFQLFADPPMRLHNGRELHVPTQAPLRWNVGDDSAVIIDVLKFNIFLPPASLLNLLIGRVSETKSVVKALALEEKQRQAELERQMQRLEISAMMECSSGDMSQSIYYSMSSTASSLHTTPSPKNASLSSTKGLKSTASRSWSIRLDKFLVTAASTTGGGTRHHNDKINNHHQHNHAPSSKAKRAETSETKGIALIAFDMSLHVAAANDWGWLRAGSISLFDVVLTDPKASSTDGLRWIAPVIRSYLPQQQQQQSAPPFSRSQSISSTDNSEPTLLAVWRSSKASGKGRIALRLSNMSFDLCSSPGKIPSAVQIACEIADFYEKEFQFRQQPSPAKHSSLEHHHRHGKSLPSSEATGGLLPDFNLCIEANSLALILRTKADQDVDSVATAGSKGAHSLPGLCLSFDNVLFDASPPAKATPKPGQPPVGDMWLGLGSGSLDLLMISSSPPHDDQGGVDSSPLDNCHRRERLIQADWLEFTLGKSSLRGSTAFVDVCGSTIAISTTVNNLTALYTLVATVADGIANFFQQTTADSNSADLHQQQPQQAEFDDMPCELQAALKESTSLLMGTSPSDYSTASARRSWNSPPGRDSSSEEDFLVLSMSLVKKLPTKAECRKLTPASLPLKIVDDHLVKPTLRPDPLSVQPHGWPTPVFRFTLRDTTIRCALLTERGDALEIGLVRIAVRYERCPGWTPNLYRFQVAVHDVEITERHANSGDASQHQQQNLASPGVVCSRLVAEDVPRIHSSPHLVLKVAVVRQNNSTVPLLKQNSMVVSEDAECDVRLSAQPIRLKASKKTLDILQALTSKLNSIRSSTSVPNSSSLPTMSNVAGSESAGVVLAASPPSSSSSLTAIKSPTHNRGAPVLFDETSQKEQQHQSQKSGFFIRSFAVEPPVLLEVNFSWPLSTAANMPIHLDKCRLVLPALHESRSGFADVGRLVSFVSDAWSNAISSQKSAFVAAGTGINKVSASVSELASATADLGALLLSPIYGEDLPPAMTVDSQLRPGRVLRGLTTSAASLSADVFMKLFSTAVPLLQHASSLLNNNPNNFNGPHRSSTPEPMLIPGAGGKMSALAHSAGSSASSTSSLSTRERQNSRSQEEALRKAAQSALLDGRKM